MVSFEYHGSYRFQVPLWSFKAYYSYRDSFQDCEKLALRGKEVLSSALYSIDVKELENYGDWC